MTDTTAYWRADLSIDQALALKTAPTGSSPLDLPAHRWENAYS
jgi:hypothetical protein